MDPLNHVNNVAYVDYLQEARVDLLRSLGLRGALDEGVLVVRHRLTYVAPLVFRPAPVVVEVWVEDVRASAFTLGYEIREAPSAEDPAGTVYLRATSLLAPFDFTTDRPRRLRPEERDALAGLLVGEGARETPAALEPAEATPGDHRLDLQVRFSDVDIYGHANNVEHVTYFQEARIAYFAELWGGAPADLEGFSLVLARCDVDYQRPVPYREEPYALTSRVTRVGTRSFEVTSELRDSASVLSRARVVLVAFDPVGGGSAPMPEPYRALLSSKVFTMN